MEELITIQARQASFSRRAALLKTKPSYDRAGKIALNRPGADLEIKLFLTVFSLLSIVSLLLLRIEWNKLYMRLPQTLDIFARLANLSLDKFDLAAYAFLESVSVTVLATIYSLLAGIVFGACMARNLVRNRVIPGLLSAVFSFIRAVPTTVWVLFSLVCLGFGPAPGVVGLSLHAVAFFARAFKQTFEEVHPDTIEAIRATGANRFQIFFGAMLPASLSQLVAWGSIRFEINFSESAILGMVGAGGIGYTIMAAMSNYQLGRAGTAILMVFLFAYTIEILFATVKKKINAR